MLMTETPAAYMFDADLYCADCIADAVTAKFAARQVNGDNLFKIKAKLS